MKAIISTLFLFCFFCTHSLLAQNMEDVVYLKDGTVLRGELQKADTLFDSHRIKILGGNIVTFDMADVYRINKEKQNREWRRKVIIKDNSPFQYREKGYYNVTQMGLMVGQVSNPWWWGRGFQNVAHFNFQTIHGHRFHRLLAAGGGIGVSIFPRALLAPVFLDLRSDLLQKPITPHVYANVGYSVPLIPNPDDDGWRRDIKISGGFMYDVGLGIKINTASGIAYTLTGGIKAQQAGESFIDGNDVFFNEQVTYQRLSLQAGIMF